MKKVLLPWLLILFIDNVQGQSVGAGTNTPNPSAQLDVSSTTKGMLIPRMTEDQRLAIPSPAHSLIVYQTDRRPGFYYNSGTPSNPSWSILVTHIDVVTDIRASSPLSTTGGDTPRISLPGNNGGILYGTGAGSAFTAEGLPGQYLRSNGSGAPSWSGLALGQYGAATYGTGSLTAQNIRTTIPNLSQTISIQAGSIIYISTTGGIRSNVNATASSFSVVDIDLVINGFLIPGGSRRIVLTHTPTMLNMHETWAINAMPVLPAGNHTIQVMATLVQGESVTVSGSSTNILQGVLNVIVLKP